MKCLQLKAIDNHPIFTSENTCKMVTYFSSSYNFFRCSFDEFKICE